MLPHPVPQVGGMLSRSARRADLWFPAHPRPFLRCAPVLKTTLALRKAKDCIPRVVFKTRGGGERETTKEEKDIKESVYV